MVRHSSSQFVTVRTRSYCVEVALLWQPTNYLPLSYSLSIPPERQPQCAMTKCSAATLLGLFAVLALQVIKHAFLSGAHENTAVPLEDEAKGRDAAAAPHDNSAFTANAFWQYSDGMLSTMPSNGSINGCVEK